MRNLSYPEAALALIALATASCLSYFEWFVPALSRIDRDRQATRAILFELAASVPRRVDTAHGEVGAPLASKPEPVVAAPPAPPVGRQHRRVSSARQVRQTHELELDDSADPISGLESRK